MLGVAGLVAEGLAVLALMGCAQAPEKSAVSAVVPPALKASLMTLSTQPDLVSGDSVLVALDLSEPPPGAVKISLNGGEDLSASFRTAQSTHRLIGLITRLRPGENTLTAQVDGNLAATLAIKSYPLTGPIISGPHVDPFVCETEYFELPDGTTLGAPLARDCSITSRVHYVYWSQATQKFLPLTERDRLPDDVASTTTLDGERVPFIVRVDTRTIDRGIYQSAILHDPTSEPEPSPFAAPKGWNKGLITLFGYGCVMGWYRQGDVQGSNLLDAKRLGEGYALMSNTLLHATNNCNPLLGGEAMMMSKEEFIESFGEPDYTLSEGFSGGAHMSLAIADAQPGLLDGVLVGATFQDSLSIALAALDSHLLSNYFLGENSGHFTEQQMVGISGHKTARALYDMAMQASRVDPVPGRPDPIPPSPIFGAYGNSRLKATYDSAMWSEHVPRSLRYDPATNPNGARPTIFDWARNIYGTDSNGRAHSAFDNVGVQYGLAALNAGAINTQQFLDLNEHVGGFDQDGNPIAQRSIAQRDVLERVYRSGASLSGGGGLANIPVFDISYLFDEDQLYHYQWFHFATRERMKAFNGNSANHVMWRGGVPATERPGNRKTPEGTALDLAVRERSWAVFSQWVRNYKADHSNLSQAQKVVHHRPVEAVDGCFTRSLTPQFIPESQTLSDSGDTQCNRLWPSWTFPREKAGGPLSADVLKCELKKPQRADYQVAFDDVEWSRLNKVFPEGVCDWSKAGVGAQRVSNWYSAGPARLQPSAVKQTADLLPRRVGLSMPY